MYNFIIDGLDLSNPFNIMICLVVIAIFLLIGHKVIIPFYKKYFKRYIQKTKNK